jgi:hypothetical protein
MAKGVYLAGGIMDLKFADARGWRDQATLLLQPELEAISPLNLEGPVYKKLAGGINPDQEMSLTYDPPACRYIVDKDLIAIRQASAMLVNISKPSWGTAMEIFEACRYANKMVVAFGDPDARSPWVLHHIHMNCPTLEYACDVLKEMLARNYI